MEYWFGTRRITPNGRIKYFGRDEGIEEKEIVDVRDYWKTKQAIEITGKYEIIRKQAEMKDKAKQKRVKLEQQKLQQRLLNSNNNNDDEKQTSPNTNDKNKKKNNNKSKTKSKTKNKNKNTKPKSSKSSSSSLPSVITHSILPPKDTEIDETQKRQSDLQRRQKLKKARHTGSRQTLKPTKQSSNELNESENDEEREDTEPLQKENLPLKNLKRKAAEKAQREAEMNQEK